MKTQRSLLILAAVSTAAVAACSGSKGETPVNYSAPVGITLNVKSSDILSGVVVTVKNVNTVPGNPFAAFIGEAQTNLGGNDPSSVTLASLTLSVTSGGNAGISTLDQIYDGPVTVTFQMSTTTAEYPAGSASTVTGTSATMSATFDSTQMTPADYTSFLGGQFKVAVSGTAAAGFAAATANVPVTATFTFEALK